MRKKNLPRLLLLLCFAISAISLSAQTVHTITLFVNTAEINAQNMADQCNFGQPAGTSNEEYTIDARLGDIIVWKGISTNAPGTDMVGISAINHQGGVNVFGKNVLNGNSQEPEMVTATIVQGAPGDVNKYMISFKVFNNGTQRGGTFRIDPKIRVQP